MRFTILHKEAIDTSRMMVRTPSPRDLGVYYLFTNTVEEITGAVPQEATQLYHSDDNGSLLLETPLIMAVGRLMATDYMGAIELHIIQARELQASEQWKTFIEGTDEQRAELLEYLQQQPSAQ